MPLEKPRRTRVTFSTLLNLGLAVFAHPRPRQIVPVVTEDSTAMATVQNRTVAGAVVAAAAGSGRKQGSQRSPEEEEGRQDSRREPATSRSSQQALEAVAGRKSHLFAVAEGSVAATRTLVVGCYTSAVMGRRDMVHVAERSRMGPCVENVAEGA